MECSYYVGIPKVVAHVDTYVHYYKYVDNYKPLGGRPDT